MNKWSSVACHKISDKNYEHVFNVWKTFRMKSVRDFHEFSLESNALSLANVFQNFRSESIDFF